MTGAPRKPASKFPQLRKQQLRNQIAKGVLKTNRAKGKPSGRP